MLMGLGIHLFSVLVLAVIAETLCRIGRFRPALCHALWLVVLVKLMTPPVVAWPTDGLPAPALAPAFSTKGAAPPPESKSSVALVSWAASAPATTPAAPSPPVQPPFPSYGLWIAYGLAALWLVGSMTLFGRLLWHAQRARAFLATGESAPSWLTSSLQSTADAMGIRAPRAIIVPSGCGSVYVHVLGRPTLVIADNALEEIDGAKWPAVLTHELAHLKRRDHWVAWLLLIATTVWWWNPLLWWVRNRVQLHSEFACDAWVVREHPNERKNYAETMVRFLALQGEQTTPAPAMGLGAWPAEAQKRRLEMVMKGNGNCALGWGPAIAVALTALVVAPAWYATADEEASAAPPAPAENLGWTLRLEPTTSVENTLKAPVNIEFEDIYITDMLQFIQESFDLNVVLDPRVVAPNPEANPESSSERANPTAHGRYVTDGMIGFLNLKDTPLEDALAAMLESLNLTHQAVGNTVWISSAPQFAADRPRSMPASTFDESDLLKQLAYPVNIEFEDIHIRDVVAFLQDSFEVNIVVDSRVVMPEGGNWSAPPLGSTGFTTDGMIPYICLKDIPINEALYHLTRMLDLTYTVEQGYVFISTPELVVEARKPDLPE